MKKKSFIISILSSIATLCLFVGCSGDGFTVDPAQNGDLIPDGYFSQVEDENDPEMFIDGKLDEEIYKDINWLEYSFAANVDRTLPKMQVTGFTTEYGVYIASKALDTNVRYGAGFMEQIAPANTTFFSYYIVVDKKGEEPSRFRNNWFNYSLDCKGNAVGRLRARHASFVKGEINSGATEYVSCEIFFPWSQLGFTAEEIPDTFGMIPSYQGCFPGTTNTKKFELQPSLGNDRVENYYRFGTTENGLGYTNPEPENGVFGNAFSGYPMTPLWDLSKADENTVEGVGGAYNVVYFKDAYADNYVVSTRMIPKFGVDDPYPKAGIFMMTTEGWYYTAMLDMQPNWVVKGADGVNTLSKLRVYTLTNNHPSFWDFKGFGNEIANEDYAQDQGVEFTLVKNGARFYYFADGQYIGAEEVDSAFAGKTFAGLYTLAMDVVFTDCEYQSLTQEEVTEILNAKSVYLIEAENGSSGGKVEVSDFQAFEGDEIEVKFSCKTGYQLSSVLINGEEALEKIREDSQDGIYRLTVGQENVLVKGYFKKIEQPADVSGFVVNDTTKEKIAARLTFKNLDDPTLIYEIASSPNKGYTAEIAEGNYVVTCSTNGYNFYREEFYFSGERELEISLSEMPKVGFIDWQLVYSADENKITNPSDGGNALAITFQSKAQTVYFAGKFVTERYDNYSFIVESEGQKVHYMFKEAGYRRGGIEFSEVSVINYSVAPVVDYTSCLKAGVMSEYPVKIWKGEITTWEYEVFIYNDYLYVFIDGILCWYISLVADGFTAGSSYSVGLARTWNGSKVAFSVENVKLFTGEKAQKKMQNFLNLDIQTFTAIDWTSKAATRYLSDGSIETVRQEKTVNQQADYNGYYATWLKGKSNAVYYKATLTVNASALTFDRGLGFAIAKGTKKFAFGFGGSSLKQWVPSQADASAYVKNASKILELTTNTNGERSFTVEYIVYNNTLYFFVDGVLTVQIDLATLFAGESGEYQIGLFSRWPSTLFKGGYYAPETYYGEQAVEKIVASGYFAN